MAVPPQPQQGQEFNNEEQQQQQQHNTPIIHERHDSKDELARLFAVVDPAGSQRPLQVPMKMRKFPDSFWRPPTIGSKSPGMHSRENSLDNGPFSPGPVDSPGPGHHRTSSCPATLGQFDRAAAQGVPHVVGHQRHLSFDVGGPDDALGPLPPGWEKSVTPQGQVYYLNHNNKTTQWEDPRKTLYQNSKIRQLSANGGTVSPRNAVSPIPGAAGPLPQQIPPQQQQQGPLPDGWELKFTDQGEQYFVDHVSKKTQWQDPRITQAQAKQQQHLNMKWNMLEKKKMQLSNFQRNQVRHRNNDNVSMSQAQEMMMRHSLNDGVPGHTNIDPFLSGETHHNKQESADSGLGMGSNFNLGSIPEDMGLETMDTADLDTTLTEGNQGGPNGGMETDQLIPSLPELGDSLSQDIMQTILSKEQQQQQQQVQQDTGNLWL